MIFARVAARRSAFGPRGLRVRCLAGPFAMRPPWPKRTRYAKHHFTAYGESDGSVEVPAADEAAGDAVPDLRGRRIGLLVVAQVAEAGRKVGEALGDHVDHVA